MDIASKFKHIVNSASSLAAHVPNSERETIMLWPEAGAMILYSMTDNQYTSISIESELHKVYAYWAPGFDPVYLDCTAEDFDKFFEVIIDIESKSAIIH